MKHSTHRTLILLIFFLTGFNSLIYEISWVRQATLTFGVSIFAYSAVLTAYMGGMAIGGYWIGKRADRAQAPLRTFAWLQVFLAVLGFLTPFLLKGMTEVYSSLARGLQLGTGTMTFLRLILAVVVLTPPSIFIGAVLPFMSRIYARQDGQVGKDVGALYAVNTFGSVLGCLLAAIYFLRIFGLLGTISLSSVTCLVVAVVLFWMENQRIGSTTTTLSTTRATRPPVSRRKRRTATANPHESSIDIQQAVSSKGLRFALWAYGVSGFAALAYEVVWSRLISLFTVGAVYSFSLMLAVFLTGLALGGLAGTWWIRHRRTSLVQFGALEFGIGFLAITSLFVIGQLARLSLEDIFGLYSVGAEMAFESMLSAFSLFPATFLMGIVFPVVSSLYTSEQTRSIGLNMSRLVSLNTAGSILGSLLAGFVILPMFGMRNSVLVLALVNAGIAALTLWFFGQDKTRARLVAVSLITVTILASLLAPKTQYLGYWQNQASQVIFYKEGVETTVAVFEAGADNPKFSTVNGRVEVPTDVLSMRAFYLLGHLPSILRPDAQKALMLSFGNGIASGAMSTHNIPSLEVVELAPEMVEAARQVYTQENRDVMDYSGLKIHIEDARNFLLQNGQEYDIITTDATHPSNSSSWTLFTQEFYLQIRDHLTSEGVFLQWVPLHSMAIEDYKAILRTFQAVFPNATLWYTGGSHTLLLATPFELTDDYLATKLQPAIENPAVLQDLGQGKQISRHWIMTSDQVRLFTGEGRIVRDDNAYFLPVNAETSELVQIIQQAAIQSGH